MAVESELYSAGNVLSVLRFSDSGPAAVASVGGDNSGSKPEVRGDDNGVLINNRGAAIVCSSGGYRG